MCWYNMYVCGLCFVNDIVLLIRGLYGRILLFLMLYDVVIIIIGFVLFICIVSLFVVKLLNIIECIVFKWV